MTSGIITGDCQTVLPTFATGSIDLTVTSPPYDNLRTYNGTLSGWTEAKWKTVIAELYRVTKEGGVVVWIVADATIKGSETGTSFRQALHAMECGFRLHDTMIYEKQNPVPYHHNRYQPCYEFMFILSKGKPIAFNPILVESKGIIGGSKQRSANGDSKKFNSGGAALPTKYRKNIWTYALGEYRQAALGHPAPFPTALVRDHILSWSSEGDTVLDPFIGSGTTGVVAQSLNRDWIGIELNPTYAALARDRIAMAAGRRTAAEFGVSATGERHHQETSRLLDKCFAKDRESAR